MLTFLAVLSSVAGFTYYVVKYVKPWISVFNMINNLFGTPIINTEDEESDFQTQPQNYQPNGAKVEYKKANIETESFDVE